MTELNYLLVSCTLFLLGIWGIFFKQKKYYYYADVN